MAVENSTLRRGELNLITITYKSPEPPFLDINQILIPNRRIVRKDFM